MLPIVNQDVQARKVSIYNQAVLARNPLNGVWLTNDTKLSLLAGPVTVFDGGTYAGDARLDNLAPGEKRLLSYAIDLEVTVDPTSRSTQKIVSARIVRGVLHTTRRDEYTQVYALQNKAEQPRTVIIEHPRDNSRKLLTPAKPAEETPSLYRFEVQVPAAEKDKAAEGKFTVIEERIHGERFEILPCDVGTIMAYASNKEIPSKVRDALTEAAKRKNDLADAQSKAAAIRARISAQQDERAQSAPGNERPRPNGPGLQDLREEAHGHRKQTRRSPAGPDRAKQKGRRPAEGLSRLPEQPDHRSIELTLPENAGPLSQAPDCHPEQPTSRPERHEGSRRDTRPSKPLDPRLQLHAAIPRRTHAEPLKRLSYTLLTVRISKRPALAVSLSARYHVGPL